ncbi:MAG: diaminobutyrate--2-oxoglutarate transaminase [Alphaproteobacteria bacterium]|nr:diaminobutyrate--2-oxoglutarate transaminase [Alphaproteobacteria bacterium]
MPKPSPSPDPPDTAVFDRVESGVRSYCRLFPRKFVRGRGAWLYDAAGGAYLDFLSACGSLNYGHNHPVLKAALLDYLEQDGLAIGLDLHTEAKERFLAEFERSILRPRGLDYRLMCTGPTGANSVEAALKLARKVTGRHNVIAFTNGFHGMSLGALAATGDRTKREGAALPLGGITREGFEGYYGPAIDTAALLERRLADPSSGLDKPAAILLETVQGEGGVNAASAAWAGRIAQLARAEGALLIVDEIQTGCGRTGRFFGFEELGLKPDIVTLAKSLSGLGLPFAATLFRPELDIFMPGQHNGTFRGNCHAFVTGEAALRQFWRDDGLEREVARKGALLAARLAAMAAAHRPFVRRAKGRGMLQGIELSSGALAAQVIRLAFARGLVIEGSGPHDEVLKVMAPLVIGEDELMAGLDILQGALEEVLVRQRRVAVE